MFGAIITVKNDFSHSPVTTPLLPISTTPPLLFSLKIQKRGVHHGRVGDR